MALSNAEACVPSVGVEGVLAERCGGRSCVAHDQRVTQELSRQVGEKERALEQHRVLTARLETSNRDLEEFASVASHDLQEPLRKITTFAERLSARHGEALGPEGRDYLDRVTAAAQRMQTLIRDVLRLSQVGPRGEPSAPVDLGTVVGLRA